LGLYVIGIYIIGKYIDLRYHPNCSKIIDLKKGFWLRREIERRIE